MNTSDIQLDLWARRCRRKILNHGGASEGMVAFIAMLLEERLGLVILTNVRFTPLMVAALQLQVFESFLDIPRRDWSAQWLPMWHTMRDQQKEEAQRVQGTKPSLALEQYTGTYEDAFYGKANVTWTEGI